jgi:hypothetical protein
MLSAHFLAGREKALKDHADYFKTFHIWTQRVLGA